MKSLELTGYKTFANKTDFEFADFVTAIVGPNGSGKSNIADALRWVLGEQSFRLLRGRKTEDMIFSGSEHKPRAGMASATIVFDNSNGWLPIDFSEVSISRRAFRDGQNEYLINGQRVRLRDISELLAKSGLAERTYTIIGQGLIDAALSLRADERRRLFEEAAGIGLYRSRREEALRRLDATRRNIDRVKDILAELTPRLRSLERQMKRYEEHEQVKDELHQVLLEWYGFHWHRSQKEYLETQEAARLHEAGLRDARQLQTAAENELETLRQKYLDLRGELGESQGELAGLHTRRERTSRELAVLDERRLALERQAKELEITLAGLDQQISFENDLLSKAKEEAAGREADNKEAISRAESSRQALEVQLQAQQAYEAELQGLRDEAARLAARRVEITTRQSELQAQLDRFDQRRADAADAAQKSEYTLKEAESAWNAQELVLQEATDARRDFRLEFDALLEDISSRVEARTSLTNQINGLRSEVARLTTQDEVLAEAENALVGYGSGARTLLEAGRDGKIQGIRGALRDLIEVPERLDAAISGALGEYVNALIVQGRGEAEAALGLLTQENNRGILLPLEDLRPNRLHSAPPFDGLLGIAADLITAAPPAKPAVDLILGRTLVVDDLPAARRALDGQPDGAQAVTLKGEVIVQDGPIMAGASKDDAAFSRPRRRRQLAEEISALNSSIDELEEKQSRLDEQLGQLETERKASEVALAGADARLLEAQESSRIIHLQKETTSHQAEWQKSQLEALENEDLQNRQELQDSDKELETLEVDIRATQEKIREVTASQVNVLLEEARDQVNHWELQVAISQQVLDGARARISERQAVLEKALQQKEEANRRMEEITAGVSGLEGEISALKSAEVSVAQEIESYNQKTGPVESELEQLEKALDQNRVDESKVRHQLTLAERYHTQAQIALARQQEAMETLRRRIEDDFGLVAYAYEEEISGPNPLPLEGMVEELPVVTELSPDLETSLNRRRLRLRRMGPINPEAPEEYNEVRDRNEFLTSQLEDLDSAEQHIKDVIAELDTLMEREFRKTFDAVAGEFRTNFSRLFGGGTAQLILTDPDDLTNSGIDIDATLPGRRTQGLSLLSGGERSLVASALIFALIQVSPTPFCVLDEVDAMLDEANVGRFREMLRELSESTQFILITHNRGTVEAADVIYGITMGRDSTSQMLSLKLDQVAEMVA
ncbi:MAG: chromosome segregation protein SMC [Anaerolineales bacterium]|nr:chromosome segregation protein SMC [Anaerolineales bacterium]